MSKTRQRERNAPLSSNAYSEIINCWNSTMLGGTIVCATYAKAIQLRYRMYRYRTLLCEQNGSTPYDDLIIQLKKDDTRLHIQKQDHGILEIIPDNPNPTNHADELLAYVHETPGIAGLSNRSRHCRWCKQPITDSTQHGIGVCWNERGRDPVTLTNEE